MKISPLTALLIALHLFILNGLFTYRYPTIAESQIKNTHWILRVFRGEILDYIKLYYSFTSDEANFYEWSTVVLGKSFEKDYSFEYREVSSFRYFFSETPTPHLPYREVMFEYPPLMALPLLTARLLSTNYLSFVKILAWLISFAYLGCLAITYRLWQMLDPQKRFSWSTILLLSASSILIFGQLYVTRLDVFPSLLYLLALWTFLKEKFYTSAAWIVAGVFAKGYAILLAPLFGLVLLKQKKFRILFSSIAIVLTSIVLISYFLAWLTHGEYWESFRFHSMRGIQIESSYALLPYLMHLLINEPIIIFTSHGAHNISFSYLEILLLASKIIPGLLFASIYIFFWKGLKNVSSFCYKSFVLEGSLLLVLGFIITFKIGSPQFLIWLTPLIFLFTPHKRKKLFFGIFGITLFLNQLIFPAFHFLLEKAHPVSIVWLLVKILTLGIIFTWIFHQWVKRDLAPNS